MAEISKPLGKWSIDGNEEQGSLEITSVDNTGNLMGTAFGDNITGAFQAPSGVIHFARKMNPSLPDYQLYIGHISIVPINVDAPQYLLAGSYHTIPFGLIGWYATIVKVLGSRF
jgi:hypothetical protein